MHSMQPWWQALLEGSRYFQVIPFVLAVACNCPILVLFYSFTAQAAGVEAFVHCAVAHICISGIVVDLDSSEP